MMIDDRSEGSISKVLKGKTTRVEDYMKWKMSLVYVSLWQYCIFLLYTILFSF